MNEKNYQFVSINELYHNKQPHTSLNYYLHQKQENFSQRRLMNLQTSSAPSLDNYWKVFLFIENNFKYRKHIQNIFFSNTLFDY